MANVNGGLVACTVKGGLLRKAIFSGTVKLAAAGVVRAIKGYKVGWPTVVYETTSDASGNWSLLMVGGTNDKFRIIAVGIDGENSEIFDGLSG